MRKEHTYNVRCPYIMHSPTPYFSTYEINTVFVLSGIAQRMYLLGRTFSYLPSIKHPLYLCSVDVEFVILSAFVCR